MLKALILSLACGTATVVGLPLHAQTSPPRTLVEAIDLSTPEATTLAFMTAFSRSDYFAASFMLTFKARFGFQAGMQTRDAVRALFPASDGTIPGAAIFHADGRFIEEQSLDFSRLFDDVMIHAEASDLLPFRILPGAQASLVGSEEGLEHGRAEARLEGGVTLYLVQKSPDLWLIDRIGYPGAKPAQPW